MTVIELQGICKDYHLGKRTLRVLRDVALSVRQGEFVAIMGPSGSGKSTLMHIIGCLDVATRGKYILADQDISALSRTELVSIRRRNIGFIFQNFNLLPRMSARENVALPLLYNKSNNRRKADEMIDLVGLHDRAKHKPSELSGGEMQRVAIARALVNDPKVIVADEPTGNLDSKTGKEIMDLFGTLHAQGRTIVMVTHDKSLAERAERIITIQDGAITHA